MAVAPGGEPLVVLANRLPIEHVIAADGTARWRRTTGGLVSTLEPVVRDLAAVWIGYGGGAGSYWASYGNQQMYVVGVPPDEAAGYYEGYSNSTIWPLYHNCISPPVFRSDWWDAYVRVNRRFAEAAAARTQPHGTVWVHDYHLQLVPALLRAMRPDLRIGFFLHIPVPEPGVFRRLPQREQILRGLCGADLVGVQRQSAVHALRRLVLEILPAEADDHGILLDGRRVRVAHFPASVEVDRIESIARRVDVRQRARGVRAELGEPTSIILAVERLDHTKGTLQRLEAYRALLADCRFTPPGVVLVQVLPPSRQSVRGYRVLRRRIAAYIRAINIEFGAGAVVFWDRAFPLEELVPLYLAADVMAVTPLLDGMNLVAKEFVAARVDGGGALVLSEFAGVADQFDQAYLVNPFDVDALKAAICRAIEADPAERRARMLAMRRLVSGYDVRRWGREFLAALAQTASA